MRSPVVVDIEIPVDHGVVLRDVRSCVLDIVELIFHVACMRSTHPFEERPDCSSSVV